MAVRHARLPTPYISAACSSSSSRHVKSLNDTRRWHACVRWPKLWFLDAYEGLSGRCLLLLQSVFFTYGAMAPESAALAAELLGFDPELVVPQLSARVKSG